MEKIEPIDVKLVLIGEASVGKSVLLTRFTQNEFKSWYNPTVGIESETKLINVENGPAMKATIWDTSGVEMFRQIVRQYSKGAVGALLCYDITAHDTFSSLPLRLQELRDVADKNVAIVLVGTKCDLQAKRAVTTNEGFEFSKKNNLLFIETSAKDFKNVQEAFTKLAEEIYRRLSSTDFVKAIIQKENEKSKNENHFLKKIILKVIKSNNELKQEIKKNPDSETGTVFLGDEELKELKNIELIGSNVSSKVYKVERTKNIKVELSEKNFFSLKVLNSSNVEDMRKFIREFEILSDIGHHPCLLYFEGFSYGSINNSPTMIYKYYPTTLFKEITAESISLTNTEKVRIIVEILLGMIFIQEKKKMIHRDLKPENILLTKNKHVRIGDFGLATATESIETSFTKGIGTLQYMSPEFLNGDSYSFEVDRYSFGMLVYFILANGMLPEFKMRNVINGNKIPIPKEIPKLGGEIITKCCSFDPKDRPTFSEILRIIKVNKYEILPDIDVDLIEERITYLEMKVSVLCE